MTAYEILKEAGKMDKNVLCASVDGKIVELSAETEGKNVEPVTFSDPAGKKVFWHTASHILAQAVKRLYPTAKLTIGPAIDNGFYYDIDSDVPFTPEVLKNIESEMKKIVHENLRMERFLLPRDEAIRLMESREEPYKVALIARIPEGEDISFYRQ
ncbi:MAG: threonine--tRNA ligase, partial [Eubacteriales bacterium]